MNSYILILQQFNQQQIPYAVIGTWALKWMHPNIMQDYVVKDCDLLIANNITTIRQAIDILQKASWTVSVWETTINEMVDADFLKGKYYLRATKDDLILDLTYECPFIAWTTILNRQQVVRELTIANQIDILYLKRIKGRPIDFEIIKRFMTIEDLDKIILQ